MRGIRVFDEAFGRMGAAPDAYCYYTVEFIEALDKHWPDLNAWSH
jgi:hypothetical protein